ncbi:MAG: lactate utilization protein B [Gammaproteobacteria bacterium]
MSRSGQPLDAFAAGLSEDVRATVADGAAATDAARRRAMETGGDSLADLRDTAAAIRQHALDHLDTYLAQAEASLTRCGARVHFAATAASAREQVTRILQEAGVRRLVKSKSMVAEEIGLAEHLTAAGTEVVESDLGELVVQLDGDRPSHIVKPIIHRRRDEIASTFRDHGLGDYDPDPESLTRRARAHLRRKFLAADASISGANFVSAESGRLVVVTNEGNNRFGAAAAPLHIAVVGIEKVVATDRDLSVLLALLARSATGQAITAYTEFMRGPRPPGRSSGPAAFHVVFYDGGRSRILGSEWREILRCIRCGACMNACPVYREASGHAYGGVYPGPVGAVLEPLLAADPDGYAERAGLAYASTLCGACGDVCPVKIPLPDLLVRHRVEATARHLDRARAGVPGTAAFSAVAARPGLWRIMLSLSGRLPAAWVERFAVGPLRRWLAQRTLPRLRGGAFRRWLRGSGGKDG